MNDTENLAPSMASGSTATHEDGSAVLQIGGSQTQSNNSDDTSAAAQTIKRRKYTKRNAKDAGAGTSGMPQPSGLSAQEIAALDELFKPELWKRLVCLPADAMLAKTGNDKRWNLPEPEKEMLATGAAYTAKLWMIVHPKYVALGMFAVAIATTYGTRFIGELQDSRERKRIAEEEKANKK